jgi:hypothetical protein
MSIDVLGKKFDTEAEALSVLQSEIKRVEGLKASKQRELLRQLPQQLGYSTVDELILGLGEHASAGLRERLEAAKVTERVKRTRSGTKLSPEQRTALNSGIRAKEPVAELAAKFNVSRAYVYLLKKSMGEE